LQALCASSKQSRKLAGLALGLKPHDVTRPVLFFMGSKSAWLDHLKSKSAPQMASPVMARF
jgi:hypothetical protein